MRFGRLAPSVELLAEAHAGAVDAALRCCEREIEGVSDLLVRPAFDVAEHDRNAKFERQGEQSFGQESAQLVFLRDGFRAGRGVAQVPVLERSCLDALAPRALERLVDGDPVEPSRRGSLAAEALQIAPGLREGVL